MKKTLIAYLLSILMPYISVAGIAATQQYVEDRMTNVYEHIAVSCAEVEAKIPTNYLKTVVKSQDGKWLYITNSAGVGVSFYAGGGGSSSIADIQTNGVSAVKDGIAHIDGFATTNYVNSALANIRYTNMLDSTEIHFDSDGNIMYCFGGRFYKYATVITNMNLVSGAIVSQSSIDNVKDGTLFAKDNSGNFHTIGCAELETLTKGLYTRTNGTTEITYDYNPQGTNIIYFSYLKDDGWLICKQTNGYNVGSFVLTPGLIDDYSARKIGVTNGIYRISQNAPLMTLSASSFSSSSGDSSLQISGGFVMKIYVGDTVVDINIPIEYKGPYHDWSADAPNGYHYDPQVWPKAEDWNLIENWISFPIEVNVPCEDSEGNIVYEKSQWSLAQASRRFGGSLSSVIPVYVKPELVENPVDNRTDCERNGHNWYLCVCKVCGLTRAHNPGNGTATTCAYCINKNGPEKDGKNGGLAGGEFCSSYCIHGGSEIITAESYHHGWHDGDDIFGNDGTCVCECGNYELTHSFSDKSETTKWTAGYFNETSRTITPGTEKDYHHGVVSCNRDSLHACGAKHIVNSGHDYDPESEENEFYPVHHSTFIPIVEAKGSVWNSSLSVEYHAAYYTCSKCSETGCAQLERHTFGTGDNQCYCTVCETWFHTPVGGNRCGDHVFNGNICSKCGKCQNEVYETNFKDPLNHNYGVEVDQTYHKCFCGFITPEKDNYKQNCLHYDVASPWGKCDACGANMPGGESQSGGGTTHHTVQLDDDETRVTTDGKSPVSPLPNTIPTTNQLSNLIIPDRTFNGKAGIGGYWYLQNIEVSKKQPSGNILERLLKTTTPVVTFTYIFMPNNPKYRGYTYSVSVEFGALDDWVFFDDAISPSESLRRLDVYEYYKSIMQCKDQAIELMREDF